MTLADFATKLASRFNLTYEDTTAITSLPNRLERYEAGSIISSEKNPSPYVGVIVTGFASSFKIVNFRGHQIVGFLLRGDTINVPSLLIGRPSAHLIANVDTEVSWIAHQDLRLLCLSRPNIASALWLDTLIDAGIARDWMANIGQRRATHRIAHLFLELAARLECIGELIDDTFLFPIKQPAIASAVGLSLVHTNKSLRALDAEGF